MTQNADILERINLTKSQTCHCNSYAPLNIFGRSWTAKESLREHFKQAAFTSNIVREATDESGHLRNGFHTRAVRVDTSRFDNLLFDLCHRLDSKVLLDSVLEFIHYLFRCLRSVIAGEGTKVKYKKWEFASKLPIRITKHLSKHTWDFWRVVENHAPAGNPNCRPPRFPSLLC